MNYECPECQTPYIPYSENISCPKCSDKPKIEEYPQLIDGICESFLFNLNQTGGFMPMAWITMDVSDSIQLFLFGVFDKWKDDEMNNHEPHERTKAFEVFIDDIMKQCDMGGKDFMKGYVRDLAFAVYNEFFNIREIDLNRK